MARREALREAGEKKGSPADAVKAKDGRAGAGVFDVEDTAATGGKGVSHAAYFFFLAALGAAFFSLNASNTSL
jgi:hypothetical protein